MRYSSSSRGRPGDAPPQIPTWGNALACRGLAEEAYTHFFEPEEAEEEEEDA